MRADELDHLLCNLLSLVLLKEMAGILDRDVVDPFAEGFDRALYAESGLPGV